MTHDIQVQHLLGRKARDVEGRIVGRVEELVVDNHDGEFVLIEYHLGPAAVIERIAGFVGQLPFMKYIPRGRRVEYVVRWDQMDLTSARDPHITVRRDQLDRKTL